MNRYELYELCVQNPPMAVALLRAIHGGGPRVLHEDFCGPAGICRRWLAEIPGSRTVGIDLDEDVLRFARRVTSSRRAKFIRADLARPLPASLRAAPRPDVVFAFNFAVGELHHRAELVRYLKGARRRLARGGVYICDTYGGATAFARGSVQRMHEAPGRKGVRIRYTWQQREADPLSGMVENALHFRVERAGEVVEEHTDAFVYRWRLWSVPELRDAMAEAGFKRTEVYSQLPEATDGDGNPYARPVESADELDDSFIVCVAGRL